MGCHGPLPWPSVPGAPPPAHGVETRDAAPPLPGVEHFHRSPAGAQAPSVPHGLRPRQHYSHRRAPSFPLSWIQVLKNDVSDVLLKLRVRVCVLHNLSFSGRRNSHSEKSTERECPRSPGPTQVKRESYAHKQCRRVRHGAGTCHCACVATASLANGKIK